MRAEPIGGGSIPYIYLRLLARRGPPGVHSSTICRQLGNALRTLTRPREGHRQASEGRGRGHREKETDMRANHPARALLRGAMAAVLACGLMMPAGAIAAEAQGTETPPPRH